MGSQLSDVKSTDEEAKAVAVRVLKAYKDMSRFDWEQLTSTTISCDPLPQLPCYVMAVAAVTGNGGHRPSLAFTVGTKGGDLGYWQGFFPERTSDTPLAVDDLPQLDRVLELLVLVAQIPAA